MDLINDQESNANSTLPLLGFLKENQQDFGIQLLKRFLAVLKMI